MELLHAIIGFEIIYVNLNIEAMAWKVFALLFQNKKNSIKMTYITTDYYFIIYECQLIRPAPDSALC